MGNFTFFAERPVMNYRKSDTYFVVCTLLLWGLGIFTLYSCTPHVGERFFGSRNYFVVRQLFSSALAFAGLVAFAVLPLRVIRRFVTIVTLASLVLCLMALFPGIGNERKGASRWITIPHVVTFQPSELVKFTIILYLSHLFDEHSSEYKQNSREFIYPIIALLLFVLVIFMQKDLSTGAFVFALGLSMFMATGASVSWLVPLGMLIVPSVVLMITLEPYRLMRVLAFFRPEDFTLTAGYQNFASERAISAGGLWGVGTGVDLDRVASIPEVQTDYIFAGWASSMGLLGVTLYFILLACFSTRGFRIALNCPNRFAAYGAFGCVLSILLQSLLNCAVVCGAIPTTGVPLPFFSAGGSSLIITMCMCGFVINASHCPADGGELDGKMEKTEEQNFEGIVVEYE